MADGPLVAKVGNATKAPELRYSPSGVAVAKFGIGVKPYVKGQPDQETVFYDVTCFGTLAEHAAECVAKGARVGVIGTGTTETWNDKQTGELRSKKVIIADFVGHDLRFVLTFPQQPAPVAPVVIQPPAAAGQSSVTAPAYAQDEEPF